MLPFGSMSNCVFLFHSRTCVLLKRTAIEFITEEMKNELIRLVGSKDVMGFLFSNFRLKISWKLVWNDCHYFGHLTLNQLKMPSFWRKAKSLPAFHQFRINVFDILAITVSQNKKKIRINLFLFTIWRNAYDLFADIISSEWVHPEP